VTSEIVKLTRDIISVTAPVTIHTPIRTLYSDLGLPSTVQVKYSSGETGMVQVTWTQNNYDGDVAGNYILTGTLTLEPSTSNLNDVKASITIVVEPNIAPTAITLSNYTFEPNITAQEAIGTLSTNDADDTIHGYSLVSGEGDTDNNLFEIVGTELFLKSNEGLSGHVTFSIRVSSTDPYNNTVVEVITLTKNEYETTVALQVPNTFSPNGDGINDGWTVPELKFFNKVELEVFDRAGVRLFHTSDPEAAWDGKGQNGTILKGAFFYIIRINDTQTVKQGVVIIL
jgi:gliding motility-associated-like protein